MAVNGCSKLKILQIFVEIMFYQGFAKHPPLEAAIHQG
jgi:hypothetical protein